MVNGDVFNAHRGCSRASPVQSSKDTAYKLVNPRQNLIAVSYQQLLAYSLYESEVFRYCAIKTSGDMACDQRFNLVML